MMVVSVKILIKISLHILLDNSLLLPNLKVAPAFKTNLFFNVFPKSMSAIPVSYGPADVLKVTVSFTYDRYFIEQGRGEGESGSGSKGEDTTGQGLQSVNRQPQPESERYTAEELEAERQRSYNESIAAGRSNRNRNSGVRGPRER